MVVSTVVTVPVSLVVPPVAPIAVASIIAVSIVTPRIRWYQMHVSKPLNPLAFGRVGKAVDSSYPN